MRVGIEVGGTFTDLIRVDDDGITVAKVPSTPESPDRGALDAIDAAGIDLTKVTDLVHGSTVATNAVLERKGARVCLFVTRGLRDVLYLQRHDRRAIYELAYRKPEPVVRRRDTFEVEERLAADGSVVTALDESASARSIEQAIAGGDYDAAAICFLNSYVNPDHERRVAAIISDRFPELSVTCSADVTREFREYERASTTALAAYVQPVIEGYLNRLVDALAARGFRGRFSIMQSNGGRIPAEAMSKNAIAALFSGPAAGVVGALRHVEPAGYRNLITLDMGGTSTDVSLVVDGEPELASMTTIDGLPVKTPVIDIVTVGAGGGSIAWVDDGGLLRVGPQSAGAVPGPACYGRGGTEPTVTDAHMRRGTIRAESFLDGKMSVDTDASERALEPLAATLSMTAAALADSSIQVAEANIVRAIQQVSTERGRDPRDYVLVPFGGAGPLHAARVAEDLGIQRVVVPPNAGVLSAAGLLVSDYIYYRSRTRKLALETGSVAEVRSILDELVTEVREYLTSLGIDEPPRVDRVLEMRYLGQAFEVSVPISEEQAASADAAALKALFSERHHRIFEFSKAPDKAVEIVSFRVGAKVAPAPLPETVPVTRRESEAQTTRVVEYGKVRECPVIGRDQVGPTLRDGPLLIEDGTSTIYVPGSWRVLADPARNLVMHAPEDAT